MSESTVHYKYSTPFDWPRKVIAHMTSASWQNVPHVSYIYEPDITDFYETFKRLAKEKGALNQKISFNTILLKVMIEGLNCAPQLNALIEYHRPSGKGTVHICEEINLSIPWQWPDGRMISPVLYNAGTLTLDELAVAVSGLREKINHTDIDELLEQVVVADTLKELKRFHLHVVPRILANFRVRPSLAGKAKQDKKENSTNESLTEQDLLGGTVTISNIGSLYPGQQGYFGLLEIIPPQIFAVGLGAVQTKPGICRRADGHQDIGIREILPMCLVFDHRAMDFAALVPFIKKLDEIFLEPRIMYSW